MNGIMTQTDPVAHPIGEVRGMDRILGRSHTELAEALTWCAWYAPGIFQAVMDYMDTVNGEFIPLAT